jgi:hypothetical protein
MRKGCNIRKRGRNIRSRGGNKEEVVTQHGEVLIAHCLMNYLITTI